MIYGIRVLVIPVQQDDAVLEVRERAKIRNKYHPVQHMTQNTKGKVTKSQYDITNESQEVNPFPAGDHKATLNRRTRNHKKTHTPEIT